MIPQRQETGNLPDDPGHTGTSGPDRHWSAGLGERNIHHADCTNVTMRQHQVHPQAHLKRHTSLNTYTGTVGGPGRV
ncbi:hypothetical protein SAMN04488571_105160 [Methanoculleus thermophilus]|jgi:hypothetical protein|uniref:Uncharacterized protein n=1 Tax=Methanoculleus thermophilus TaxID=2200 RepID=A0A1G9A6P4_9EURY|nr:hypothetical protein SAMN04488571_105160 [Methanoculleus thermophilus]